MHWVFCLILLTLFQVISIDSYVSKCVKPGIKCANCESLRHCVQTPKGLIYHQLNFCNNTEGMYCSVEEGGCSSNPASCKIFGLKQMSCQNSSTFPDPYDCTAYHQCILTQDGTFTSVRHECSDDRAYDPLSTTCRFKPNHRVCRESPVSKCLYSLQNGALKENPSIYYFCVRNSGDFVPLLYRCSYGNEYKPNIHSCVEVMDSKAFTCIAEGKFVHPEDSTKYFSCKNDKTYVEKTCGKGQYFSVPHSSCRKIPRQQASKTLANNP